MVKKLMFTSECPEIVWNQISVLNVLFNSHGMARTKKATFGPGLFFLMQEDVTFSMHKENITFFLKLAEPLV